jgi:hypothetical protein
LLAPGAHVKRLVVNRLRTCKFSCTQSETAVRRAQSLRDARPAYPKKQRAALLSTAINYILNSRNEHTSRLIHHCDELYVYARDGISNTQIMQSRTRSRLENGKVLQQWLSRTPSLGFP